MEVGGEIIDRADEATTSVSSSENEATRVIKTKSMRKRGPIARHRANQVEIS